MHVYLYLCVVNFSQVVTKHKSKARVTHVSRSLKKLGKGVGRLNQTSIAREAMNDQRIRERILNVLGEKIWKEMKAMCSLMDISILRDTSQDSAILQVGYPGCRIAVEGSNTHKGPEAMQSRTRKPSKLQRKTRQIPYFRE